MLSRYAPSLCLAALLTASAAMAQPGSEPASKSTLPTSVSPLTVPSQSTSKVIERQASRFVQSYAAEANPRIEQIARWHDPVCVRVYGNLQPSLAAKIKARIEGMGQSLGLPAAGSDCTANVHILFTDEPQDALDAVAQLQGTALGYDHREKAVKTVTHPIQSWYVTSTQSDGVSTAGITDQNGASFMGSFFQNRGMIDDPKTIPPAGCVSRFTSCYASAFTNVLIVADTRVVGGQSLRLVADDMVMLALSQPKSLDACNALPSVLDRFTRTRCPGRDPPDGMTAADSAYLTALYSSDPEGNQRVQHSAIAQRMAAILIDANGVSARGAGSTGSPPGGPAP